MLRASVCVMAVVAFLWGGGLLAEDAKSKKDPPKSMEGPIKKLDTKDPEAVYVTITIKRMQPTDKEDVLQEVDKDYRFRIGQATKILGLDGKPEKQRLKEFHTGDRVRVEYKDDTALEVRKVLPK
jgi:hypothetical protein